MPIERCDACGFDGHLWSGEATIEAIRLLPDRWVEAVAGLGSDALRSRPIPEMWSIAEYGDHVREVLVGMHFLLDSAVAQPGIDLGNAPASTFSATPRAIDVSTALTGIRREAAGLADRLVELPESSWSSTATVDGNDVDAHWICRHALHDATHHLADIDRLRQALEQSRRGDSPDTPAIG
jgi:hypothetical protein